MRINDSKVLESLKIDNTAFGKLTTGELIKRSGRYEVYSVGSLVTRGGQKFHIPMMNFHPEVDHGEEFVLSSLESLRRTYPELISPGVLVASGRYFHYYGFNLVGEHALSKFLSHFLMSAILVTLCMKSNVHYGLRQTRGINHSCLR